MSLHDLRAKRVARRSHELLKQKLKDAFIILNNSKWPKEYEDDKFWMRYTLIDFMDILNKIESLQQPHTENQSL